MKILLQRTPPSGEALPGTITIDGDTFCNSMENNSKRLFAGWYPVRVTMSPKFKRPLPILDNTGDRTGIRIHRGSKPEHSTGCILVPADKEKELTNRIIQAQREHEPIYIAIQDADTAPLYDVPFRLGRV